MSDTGNPRRWVWIERVGDLYVGEAYDDDGTCTFQQADSSTFGDLHEQMTAAGVDCLDIDSAAYNADCRADAHRDDPLDKQFFLLRVRAGTGRATAEDERWVVDELTSQTPVIPKGLLVSVLADLGPQHEALVAPFLDHPNTHGEAEQAMRALIRMGLTRKYAPRLIEWMRGAGPPVHGPFGRQAYGIAVRTLRNTRDARLLQTFIEAAKDSTEKWTTREHALSCLAHVVDVENVPVGVRLLADAPYFQDVLAKAEELLAHLHAADQSGAPDATK